MKKIIALLFLTFLCACASDIDIKENTGSIIGIVADKTTGEPVPVVNLTLTPGGKSTVTGNDGSFSFTELDEGNYTVRFEKKGYKSGNADLIVAAGINTEAHLLIERIPAVITCDRELLDFGDNASMNIMSFSIINNNYVDLEFTIVANCDWITEISPTTGTLKYGKTGTVVLKIDRDKLKAGENKTIVVINTSDGSSELTVVATGAERRIPAINVAEVSNIKATSAILNGEITDKGVPKYSERGFVLSDFEMPTKENAIKIITASVNEKMTFSVRADDLVLGKTYFVRAYAANEIGIGYSTNQTKFTTIATLPQVTTLDATDVEEGTATAILHGRVDNPGDPVYYEKGFVYSTEFTNPTIDETKVIVTEGAAEFEKRVSFESASHPVYVRAYAINKKGVSYGETITLFPYTYFVDKSMNIGVQSKDIGAGPWESVNSMCKNSRVGGLNDWRLPTKDELIYLYTNRKEIGGFRTSYVDRLLRHVVTGYWSSNVDGDTYVIISLLDGTVVSQEYSTAWEPDYVYYIHGRCVRSL